MCPNQCVLPRHSPRCSKRAHQRTHQLARPRLWLSLMRLVLVVVLVASRSKSRQKSKNCHEVQKLQRSEKICKSHRFGGTFTKAPILRQTTRVSVRALTVFRALFARPKSSLNTTFGAIIIKALLMELLMRCHVLPQRSQTTLPHQILICGTHVLPLLLQFWRCAPEEDVPAQDQDGNA